MKFTPAEDPVLVVEFIELEPNPTVTNGEKKKTPEKKKSLRFSSLQSRLAVCGPLWAM